MKVREGGGEVRLGGGGGGGRGQGVFPGKVRMCSLVVDRGDGWRRMEVITEGLGGRNGKIGVEVVSA